MAQTKGTDTGTGIDGFGVTLSGATTGALGMITKVSIPGFEASEIDVTTMNSPDKWRRFIAGLKDAKQFNFDLVYDKVNTGDILAAFAAENEAWTIELPDGSTFVCDGFIQKLGTEIPMGDKITQSMTIRLSGPPTFNEASGA